MSKLLLAFAFALLAGLLALSGDAPVAAQDCERVIKGNTNSPCKKVDYLSGVQQPTYAVERFVGSDGDYYCASVLEFPSTLLLSESDPVVFLRAYSHDNVFRHYAGSVVGVNWVAPGEYFGSPWSDPISDFNLRFQFIESGIKLDDQVPSKANLWRFAPNAQWLKVWARFTPSVGDQYLSSSKPFSIPENVNDYSLLMNQCLAGISRQLEHEAALEEARAQAEADRVAAETAAEEAANAAEIAAIELQSAQDALAAQEALNSALLQETILAIKREDSLRAAWQQVILVRMAGLEERTRIWTEAVERWAAEDLQFSTAMAARIEEVERLQALNAALEQSMADQRKLLIARLEDLEQAERAAIDSRTDLPQSAAQTEAADGSGQ